MKQPKTLLQMAGAAIQPADLRTSTLVLIDCQQEYVFGGLVLPEVEKALAEIELAIKKARSGSHPIVHIMHQGAKGGLFDLDEETGKLAPQASAAGNETIIKKKRPNAFQNTNLHETLQKIGHKNIIFAGFMTHMCISSTVRAALDLDYQSWVIDKATATRDLPTADGGFITARNLHNAVISGLADRFATIVADAKSVLG